VNKTKLREKERERKYAYIPKFRQNRKEAGKSKRETRRKVDREG
jgi:hypothetical protein